MVNLAYQKKGELKVPGRAIERVFRVVDWMIQPSWRRSAFRDLGRRCVIHSFDQATLLHRQIRHLVQIVRRT